MTSLLTASYIGGYVTTMNGVDAIVFTAGIGENDARRSEVIKGMTWFGCELDADQNKHKREKEVVTEESKVKSTLIPTR